MTAEQYERWKDFALRMARTCFRGSRRPTTAWIVEVVEDFFGSLSEEDIPCIVNWDNSDDYAPGSRYYRRTYRCPCWHCSKPGADKAGRTCRCEEGSIYDYAKPYCVGDLV